MYDIIGEFNLWLCNYIIAFVPSHFMRQLYYKRIMCFSIGSNVSIHMKAYFDARKGFTIGNNSVINQGCHLDTRGGILIGENVSIAPDCTILTADHDIQDPLFIGRNKGVEIQDFVFIGTKSLILPGVKVGKGAVIAAGSVLTKDAAPFKIYAGIPAKSIGTREENLKYKLSYKRLFH